MKNITTALTVACLITTGSFLRTANADEVVQDGPILGFSLKF